MQGDGSQRAFYFIAFLSVARGIHRGSNCPLSCSISRQNCSCLPAGEDLLPRFVRGAMSIRRPLRAEVCRLVSDTTTAPLAVVLMHSFVAHCHPAVGGRSAIPSVPGLPHRYAAPSSSSSSASRGSPAARRASRRAWAPGTRGPSSRPAARRGPPA